MLTRSIGSLIRGNTTPLQILFAAVLGSMLGFMPGFFQAPGLIIALLLLLIVLNANLFLAATVGVAAKLVSLAIMSLTFQVGRVLLDGPTRPIFESAINTPVLALFGFDHYVTTGGLLLGLLFGVGVGILAVAIVGSLRRRLAAAETASETYKKFAAKGWARAASWIFFGKKGGKTYEDLLSRRFGNPIRVLGVIFAGLMVALLFIGYRFASEPIVTALLVRSLERANGATVEVQSATLDLGKGRFIITGLAMADPSSLGTDLVRAKSLEADVSSSDLLTKRLSLDRAVLRDASHGEARAVPGVLIGPRPPPEPSPAPNPGEKTIEDYLKDAEVWKQRLAQLRRWLQDAAGKPDPDTNPDGSPKSPDQRKETLRERLEREVREKGYARVRAMHLVDKAPTFLVRDLVIDGIATPQLPGDPLDVHATNISTHPSLVPGEPTISVRSRSGRLTSALNLGAPGWNRTGSLSFAFSGIATDSLAASLIPTDPPIVQGGTTDLALSGAWSAAGVGFLDLPLQITLHNATLSIPGVGSEAVKSFVLPLGLRGPLDNPLITLNDAVLADSLAKAGAGALAARARGEAAKQVDKALNKATDKLGGELGEKAKDTVGDVLGNFGKKKKD